MSPNQKDLSQSEVTLAGDIVSNPNEPRHFMKLKELHRRVLFSLNGLVLADSKNAIRLLEIGRDFYDPVIYVPEQDIVVELHRGDYKTHCPLKGDARYFDLVAADKTVKQIAWSYPSPLEIAAELSGYVAFYPEKVIVEERPL